MAISNTNNIYLMMAIDRASELLQSNKYMLPLKSQDPKNILYYLSRGGRELIGGQICFPSDSAWPDQRATILGFEESYQGKPGLKIRLPGGAEPVLTLTDRVLVYSATPAENIVEKV